MSKILIALVAVTALASLFLLQSTAPTAAFESVSIPSQVQESFEQWMVKQGKTQDSPTDKLYRLSVQNANLKRIVEHNNAGKSWTLTNNQFADLTAAEFSELQLGLKVNKNAKKNQNLELLKEASLPTSVDWRKEGAVTPIKNQGQCGSCWAFSTTGGLEGIHFLTTKNLTSFSEQQLVDCSDSQGNQGCEGGLMDQAFEQTAAKGIELEKTQPQKAVDGTCKQNTANVVWKNAGHTDVPEHSVTALLTQSALSPVSIGVDAEEWQFQEGGVQSGDCGEELDHGVLLVGQEEGSSAQQIVKNSWGEEWGENGQIRLALNKKNQAVGGMCGILNTASVPTA